MKTFRLGSVVIAGFFFVNAAEAQTTRAVQRGETIVQTYCAQCHAVGKTDTSAVEHLEEAFAEGITTGHPEMPRFQFEPDQIDDLIAYLKSLE